MVSYMSKEPPSLSLSLRSSPLKWKAKLSATKTRTTATTSVSCYSTFSFPTCFGFQLISSYLSSFVNLTEMSFLFFGAPVAKVLLGYGRRGFDEKIHCAFLPG